MMNFCIAKSNIIMVIFIVILQLYHIIIFLLFLVKFLVHLWYFHLNLRYILFIINNKFWGPFHLGALGNGLTDLVEESAWPYQNSILVQIALGSRVLNFEIFTKIYYGKVVSLHGHVDFINYNFKKLLFVEYY